MLMIIYLIALLLLIASVILLVKPTFFLDFMDKYADSTGLYAGAILARLGIGILLLYMADLSRFPKTMTVIGWIAIAAAVVFAGIGKTRFVKMLRCRWVMKLVGPWARPLSAPVFLFGGFLLYAFA
ncbi:MAG: hypothetical protein P8M72_11395 [Gammaproteobacteria bacterium]|nr:hypothetical protein [Gammaproteobacteria bacterium]